MKSLDQLYNSITAHNCKAQECRYPCKSVICTYVFGAAMTAEGIFLLNPEILLQNNCPNN